MTSPDASTSGFEFPKSERLTFRKDIQILFDTGKYISIYPLRVIYSIHQSENATPLFSISVSKKKFKHAVDRNRIKRLTKESYRLQKQELIFQCKKEKKSIQMMWIFMGNEIPSLQIIRPSMEKLLIKLVKQVQPAKSIDLQV